MLDKPEAKCSVPKSYVAAKVEFTDEESKAIAASMDEYASIWAAQHRSGAFVISVKIESGMMCSK
jgi:hypothetical protein